MRIGNCLTASLALAVTVSLWADEGPRLPKLKDFCLRTSIAKDGAPAAAVVAPDTPEYAALARQVCEAVLKGTGVALPTLTDVAADAELDKAAGNKRAMILLGNLMTNRVCARLYCMEYLDVDAAWPGAGGYLVQTVHNPFGDGRNFVSLGGSDLAGVRNAVDAFCKHLQPSGRALAVGPLFKLERVTKGPPPLSTAGIGEMVARLAGAGYRTTGYRAAQCGSALRKHRTPGYSKLFRKTIEVLWAEMDKLKICDDLRTTKWLPLIWDIIEESEQFTDDDRRYISNFMYVHAHKAPYAHRKVKPSSQPHGNNWNAEGSYLAGLYFAKYYPGLEIGRLLFDRMNTYYKGDIKHWKVSEDCPGYGDITLNANLLYARTRPDMSYFETGKARMAADYDILITTNLGTVSGFGDASGLNRKYAVGVLPIAAWYYRDGSYLWWYRHCGGNPERFMLDNLDEQPPTRLLGVKPFPLDQWIYDRKAERPMPIDKCFDKMSFRAAFGPDNQYLLLSGFSYGFHSHPDGNAIINFSDNGRVFLFDDGYMVPEMAEQNTVAVYREGRGAAIPELVQLDHVADFDRVGFSGTSVGGYNRTKWSRNIIWEKERWFLVVDELEAEGDASFAFQAFWRTMGKVRLDGRELTADQDGHMMHLVNLSAATQSVKACHAKHPFGRKLVQTVPVDLKKSEKALVANLFFVRGPKDGPVLEVETATPGVAVTRRGDALSLAGVGPCAGPAGLHTDAALFHVSASSVYLVGATKLDWPTATLRAAKPVNVALDLAKGTGTVDAADATQVDLSALGKAVAAKPGRTSFEFGPLKPEQIRRYEDALAALFSTAGRSREAAERRAVEAEAKNVSVLWQYDKFDMMVDNTAKRGVTVASSVKALPPEESYSASRGLAKLVEPNANVMFPTGTAVVLTIDLGQPRDTRRVIVRSRQLVSFRGGCGVSRIAVHVSSDGFKQDVRAFAERTEKRVPPQNARVDYALEGPPALARYVRFNLTPLTPKHKVYIDSVAVLGMASAEERREHGFVLRSMDVADLDGDGRLEVLVAASDDAVYALSCAGARLWRTPLGGRIYQLAASDLDGDGKAEVAAGCANKRLYCLKPDGTMAWDIAPPPRTYARAGYRGVLPFQGPIKVVFASDLDADGKREVCVGSGNWRTYCYDHTGKLLWDECNWAHQPTCGDAFDLNGDGTKEVVMGNDYLSAVVYHGKTGKILKTIGMTGHAGPSALAAADLDNDGKGDIVVGDRMGRVTFCVPWDTPKRVSLELGAAITFVKIGDLDSDGKAEVVVAAASGYLYVFDARGQTAWQRNLGEVPAALDLADANGDGRLELLVGCEDRTLRVLDSAGRELGRFTAGGWVQFVRVAELDGDPRTLEFVAGSVDGCVHALRFGRSDAR